MKAARAERLAHIIEVPKIQDDCLLCFIEGWSHLPFEIKRVYYIVEPKAGEPRGFHAHHQTNQALFCIRGQVRLVLDDGTKREEVELSGTEPERGILLPRFLWHEMHEMDESTVLLVFADLPFDPGDYIRDYQEFLALARRGSTEHD